MYCFTWMIDLWKHLFCGSSMQDNTSGTSISCLPNDIMSDIICRLSAQSVLACRQVHPQWLNLSSTPYFAETYLTNVTFILLGQERSVVKNWMTEADVMFLLEGFGKNPKVTKVHIKGLEMMYGCLQLYASCNGFLLFGWFLNNDYVIYNPITREICRFFEKTQRICGFFFHQLEKDYKLILYSLDECNVNYYLFSLGTTNKRVLGSSRYYPLRAYSQYEVGVVVCGAIFWIVRCFTSSGILHECSKSIMMFDMTTETFHVMPHPGLTCTRIFYQWIDQLHEQMRLLEVDNKLMSVNLCDMSIEVWVLEDTANWMWVRRYVVDIGRRFDNFASNNKHPVVTIQDGYLVLNWPEKGLFCYDLRLKTFRKMKGGSSTSIDRTDFYVTLFKSNFISNVFSDSLKKSLRIC